MPLHEYEIETLEMMNKDQKIEIKPEFVDPIERTGDALF
jgi:hypothetical protein